MYFKLEVELKIIVITTTIKQKLLRVNKLRVHNGLPQAPRSEPYESSTHTSHTVSLSSILILSSNLFLGFQKSHLPLGFSHKTLYAFSFSPMHSTCPAHPTVLNLIPFVTCGKQFKSRSSSLNSFLHPPATSFLLQQNNFKAPAICNLQFHNHLNK